jgi:inosine-uridine nucleoside N-ribohydrolase
MPKILLDTDIGTDVDDAVCLAYLLARPDCDLLGITTVTGEAESRASLASVLCRAAGKDIPIYPGFETPMKIGQKQLRAQQAAALPRWPHETRFSKGEAVRFLRDTIHANPGEIILLTVGPLTNVGYLFQEHPEVPGLLKALVSMGGMFNENSPEKDRIEWNTSGDPHATEIVYHSRVALHRSLGLDVTQRVVLSDREVRERFTSPLLQPVLDFAEIWFATFYPAITFHDPLAAAVIFDDQICTFQRGEVTIDMDERPGRTCWQPGGTGAPHEAAVSVDPHRFFDHFFGVFR